MAHQDQTVGVAMTAAENYSPSDTGLFLLKADWCSRCANQWSENWSFWGLDRRFG